MKTARRWRPSRCGSIVASCLVFALGACGGGSSSTPPPATPPQINSFTATPGTITSGGSVLLAWTSSNTTDCTVLPGGGSGSSGSLTVASVTQSTTFKLTCTGAQGTTAATATANLVVNYTLGGTISGLGADSGLMLLNNGADATTVAASSSAFTMNTPVASGSAYAITVGTQPYGLTLACAVTGGSGAATASVTSISVTCGSVTPTQKAVAGYFQGPFAVALGPGGDLFVADTDHNSVKRIPYSNGSYGTAITLGSGFRLPHGIAVDTSGNVFVADSGNNAVKKIPFSGGSYGAPVTLASGFLNGTQVLQGYWGPLGIAVSASGNVFVSTDVNQDVEEIPFSGGTYGTRVAVGSGFGLPWCIALDANDDVFVAGGPNNAIYEVPFNGSGYGASVTLGSGFNYPQGVWVDAKGNVFVADSGNQAVKEIPLSGGGYGTPVTVATGFGDAPLNSTAVAIAGLAVDANGDVFVADTLSNAIWEIPYGGSSYGARMAVSSGFSNPVGFAVDANDNLFVGDTTANAVQEIPYTGGSYHVATTVDANAFSLVAVAADANGDLLVVDSRGLTEVPFSAGVYDSPAPLALGLVSPSCITLDALGNLFAVDDVNAGPPPNQPVDESLLSNGTYKAVTTIGTVISGCSGIAVDVNQNVFVTSNGAIYELPSNGTSYGAPITLNAGSGNFRGVAVDAKGNVFVGDLASNTVKEIPFSGGVYGAPITVGSGLNAPFSVAVDKNGRLYVLDVENIWRFAP